MNGSAHFCLAKTHGLVDVSIVYIRIVVGEFLIRGNYTRMTILITQNLNCN